MREKPKERYYQIAEAARATGIPRNTLAYACDLRRIPYTRSERGYRLLSESVVEKLRKHGLSAFPRPFADEHMAPGAEAVGQEDRQPGRLTPADRIGLLGEPSEELTKAKEQAEAAKLKLEEERARLELSQVRREQEAERKAAAAERRAELEAKEEQRRQEAERQHKAEQARQEYERRNQWLKAQLSKALSEAAYDLSVSVPYGSRGEAEEAIAVALVRSMDGLMPDSPASACQRARQAALARALSPYKREHVIDRVLSGPFGEIGKYLDELYETGYINLAEKDRKFLGKRWEPYVREKLQQAWSIRELGDKEARQVVHDAIDEKLKL